MKTILVTAFAVLVFSACKPSSAMYLNPNGLGQVLVYPYYTVNGGNGTLLAVVNTASGKALKVRFHEGYDGRGVLDFNLYLSPYATWTGEVADRLGTSAASASIITNDSSCTVPAFAPLPGGGTIRFLDFSDASYSGSVTISGVTGNADGGPLGTDRTREGHFDVIEMGEVTNTSNGSLSAISQIGGMPGDCAQIVNAWAAGGYWAIDASTDMASPTGGVYGSEAVIDVEQGTLFTMNPEAIDGFSTAVQHTAPGAAAPDLDTASKSGAGTVSASVALDGRMLTLEYRNPIDAVSALFMTDTLYNEFNTDAGMGALSDWVVTAPTKRYYVDPAYIGNTIGKPAAAPFEAGFLYGLVSGGVKGVVGGASSYPYACVQVSPWSYDHSGLGQLDVIYSPGGLLMDPQLEPCLETSVLTFALRQAITPYGFEETVPSSALGSSLTNGTDPYSLVSDGGGVTGIYPLGEGVLHLDLIHDTNGTLLSQHRLAGAANGDVLVGLPMFGFLAVNYVNANVTPGVLANYSGVNRHRTHASCINFVNPQGACP